MDALRLIQDSRGEVDIELAAGGMAVGDVAEQNQWLLLVSHPGEWKEHPLVGVGIDGMLADHETAAWRRAIGQALEEDGQTIDLLSVKDGVITIKAHYKQ